jgi:hypothetical protein
MKKILITCCVAVLFFACNKSGNSKEQIAIKSELETILGSTLKIPDSLTTYEPFEKYAFTAEEILNAEYRVFTFVDASCGSCIGKIDKWENFSIGLAKYNVPIAMICISDDNFELLKYFCETDAIKSYSFPFFLDHKNEYRSKNTFMTNGSYHTVLVNKDNEILMLGNPTRSQKISDLFFKELDKRTQQANK